MARCPQLARIAATQSLPLLEAAVRDHPDDLSAGESLGTSWGSWTVPTRRSAPSNRSSASNRTASGPSGPTGRVLARLQRLDLARAALQKTIAVNPWRSDYRLALARVCSQAGDWPAADRGLPRGDPAQPRVVRGTVALVQCYLRSHEPDKADAELQTLLRFYPASREVWQQWYEQQKQAGPAGGASAVNLERADLRRDPCTETGPAEPGTTLVKSWLSMDGHQ